MLTSRTVYAQALEDAQIMATEKARAANDALAAFEDASEATEAVVLERTTVSLKLTEVSRGTSHAACKQTCNALNAS